MVHRALSDFKIIYIFHKIFSRAFILDMSDTAMVIVQVSRIVFFVMGAFGNVNIIVAIYKNKKLQHKCGILQGILALIDLLCLMSTLQPYIRRAIALNDCSLLTCYWSNVWYIFLEDFKVYLVLALSIDRQIAIQLPIKYRILPKQAYVIIMILPGVCIGIFFVVISYVLMSPDVVREVCVLPFAMPDQVSNWWNHYNMWTSVVTILIYCFTYIQLYCFSPFLNDPQQAKIQKTILSTVIVQAVLFMFSSLGSATIIMVMRNLNMPRDIVVDAETYAGIPGLLSYTCDYYVYFWRSMDYREVFKRQLTCGRGSRRNGDSHSKSVLMLTRSRGE